MSEISKIQAQKEFKTGKYTKAELARKYNVSARTMGRWLEGIQASSAPTKTQPATVAKAPTSTFTQAAVEKLNPSSVPVTAKPATVCSVIANLHSVPVTAKPSVDDVEYSVVATPRSVSITKTVNDKVEGTLTADKTNPLFDTVLNKLKTFGVFDQSVLAECYLLLKPAEAIKLVSEGKLVVDVTKNNLTYNSDLGPVQVNNTLSKRILESLKKEGKLTSTVKSMLVFLDNLMLNPSNRAVKELYGFLEANDIEITEDGHFLAWKKVRSNYMDIHSNTMLNKPGTVVQVNRNQVDEDSNITCSYGLHCCSKSYLPQFGSTTGDRVVRVKVHPRDVCAVPSDYRNAKMRTSRYEVLDDVTDSKIWR